MNLLHLKLGAVCAALGVSAISHSQVGAPPLGNTQPRAAAPDSPVAAAPGLTEGYFVANGASYYARNGQAFRVEREVSLRVLPTGMIGFDGKPLALPAGMMLTTDGRHTPIPPGINFRALPGAANPFPSSPVEAGIQPPPVSRAEPAAGEIKDTPEVPPALEGNR